jgi:hypothetical protein
MHQIYATRIFIFSPFLPPDTKEIGVKIDAIVMSKIATHQKATMIKSLDRLWNINERERLSYLAFHYIKVRAK